MDNPPSLRRALRLALCFGALCSLGGWFTSSWMNELGGGAVGAWTTAGFGALVGFALGRSARSRGHWGVFVLAATSAGAANALTLLIALSTGKSHLDRSFLASAPAMTMLAMVLGSVVAAVLFLPPLAIVYGAHIAAPRARPGSMVDEVDGGEVWFRTAALGFALSIAGSVSTIRKGMTHLDWLASAALGAMALIVAAGLVQQHRLRRLSTELRRSEDERLVVTVPAFDLGVGEDLWTSGQEQSSHYRASARPITTVLGSVASARAMLGHTTFVRGLVLVLAGASFVFAEMRPVQQPAPATPLGAARPAAVAYAAPNLSWYPQPQPNLIDLDADGVEDVVGLRWNSPQQDTALSIEATDGATFRTRWATTPIKSQWASPRTHLVMSKSALFLTDSEGMLHVYDLHDGKLTSEMKIPARHGWTAEICGDPDSPIAWFRDDVDYAHVNQGTLVSPSGELTEAARPSWCRRGDRNGRECSQPGDGVCHSNDGSQSKNKNVSRGPAVEEGDAGVTLAHAKGPTGSVLVGYDPKTKAIRWERDLAFEGSDLHASPQIETLLGNGRLYSRYQEKGGRWTLGARDAHTGAPLWSHAIPNALHGAHFDSMTVSTQRLYVAHDWHVDVFDPATGALLGTM